MRITFGMMKNTSINNLSRQSEKLMDCENEVSSGRKMNKPSDNPTSAARIVSYRTTLASIEQYNDSITKVKNRIEITDSTLDSVQTLISDAIDTAEDNLTENNATLETAIQQLKGTYTEILSLANGKSGNGYLFSGNQTRTVPFGETVTLDGGNPADVSFGLAEDSTDTTITIYNGAGELVRTLTPAEVGGCSEGTNTVVWDGLDDDGSLCDDGTYSFTVSGLDGSGLAVADYPAYQGDDGTLRVQIGTNTTMELNADGDELFTDVLKTLKELIVTFENGNYDASSISGLTESLQESRENLDVFRASQAAAYKVAETNESMLEKLKSNVEDALSNSRDADTDRAVVELQMQKTSYDASLEAVGSILSQGTLLDRLA